MRRPRRPLVIAIGIVLLAHVAATQAPALPTGPAPAPPPERVWPRAGHPRGDESPGGTSAPRTRIIPPGGIPGDLP